MQRIDETQLPSENNSYTSSARHVEVSKCGLQTQWYHSTVFLQEL
ncbi:hypothetical protein DOY81_010173 [Sarcophaga bullata]|nr:hypothetical protein DOY81_010173 [Sarcophaga bullata]